MSYTKPTINKDKFDFSRQINDCKVDYNTLKPYSSILETKEELGVCIDNEFVVKIPMKSMEMIMKKAHEYIEEQVSWIYYDDTEPEDIIEEKEVIEPQVEIKPIEQPKIESIPIKEKKNEDKPIDIQLNNPQPIKSELNESKPIESQPIVVQSIEEKPIQPKQIQTHPVLIEQIPIEEQNIKVEIKENVKQEEILTLEVRAKSESSIPLIQGSAQSNEINIAKKKPCSFCLALVLHILLILMAVLQVILTILSFATGGSIVGLYYGHIALILITSIIGLILLCCSKNKPLWIVDILLFISIIISIVSIVINLLTLQLLFMVYHILLILICVITIIVNIVLECHYKKEQISKIDTLLHGDV